MNLKRSLCWLFGLLLCQSLAAQQAPEFSNLRTHALPLHNGFQVLDMASVAQPLISVTDSISGKAINPAFIRVQNNLIRLDSAAILTEMPDCRTVLVQYRVLPFNLAAPRFRLDSSVMRRYVANDAIEFDFSPYEAPEKPWESGGLTSAGVYTRGLSFGNSQNLVFNSNLNLQLNGRLGNDLEIQAALSDNSIPLQPDGTTRQIQEFDRIFIQIKRKTTTLTAGDFDLTRPSGYFSNYFKRLQGAMVSGNEILKIGKQNDTLQYRVAAAVSKGKFARQLVQGIEGNQGPYRLFGAEGERFIIVLAGTEKVFIDGQQLRRGLGDDYVIDYNLGEVTFTSRRLITKDSRIIIEFEYAVQTFLRSTLAANMNWRLKNTHLYFNLYSEQDSRSSSGAQDLSDAERRKLAEVGDNLRNAYASGVDTLASFDPARIQYKSIDTLICGLPQTILIYTTNPDSARYTARFTELSNGQGNYVLALSSANGRVYKWVAPDPLSCAPRGNFEPIVRLIAPEKRQLYTAGADLRVRKRGRLQAEMALSTRDYNRFSPLGNQDNNGVAGFVNYSQRFEKKRQGLAGRNHPCR